MPEAVPLAAVLLDCLGTLVELEPPAPRLQAELRRAGLEVDERRAADAFAAEIAYYQAHHLEGRDAGSLGRLHDDCACVLREALGLPVGTQGAVRAAMLAALRFTPFKEVAPALRALRGAGLRLVVASNWDCSLGEVLECAGLAPLIDAVVSSAEAGAAKPGAAPFEAALAAARCDRRAAIFVGDSLANDVLGARRAGIETLLLVRGRRGQDAAQVAPVVRGTRGQEGAQGTPVVRSLDDVVRITLDRR